MVSAQRAWWTGAASWQTYLKMTGFLIAVYCGLYLVVGWFMEDLPAVSDLVFVVPLSFAISIVLYAIGFILGPFRARRNFRESKLLANEQTLRWDAEALSFEGAVGSSRIAWPLFHSWLEGPKTLLIFQSRQIYHLLPKRAFSDEALAEIIDHLAAAGVKERARYGFWRSRPS